MLTTQQRGRGRGHLMRLLAAGAALTLAGCSSSAPRSTSAPSAATIPGVVVQAKDPSHQHTTKRQTYPQTPPVGGPHWPAQAGGVLGWLRCGVYSEPVPNEFAVHSEEHGAVWLTYRPGTAAADVATLAALADVIRGYVLVSPYPGQPGAFMASTWGAQLTVATASDPRLLQFVRKYAGGGQGSELGADCAHGTLPADAVAAQARANG